MWCGDALRSRLGTRSFGGQRCLRREGQQQHARIVLAEPLGGDADGRPLDARARLNGIGIRHGQAGKTERRQCRGAMKPRAGRCIGIDERAVGSEGGDGIFAAGKQALQPFTERKHGGARRFGGDDQDRGTAVVENDARAEAGERPAEARAESAQPFQPLLRP